MRIPLLLILSLVIYCGSDVNASAGNSAATSVCIRKACVLVETASDPESRARGLMYRDNLEPGKGMFFVFDSSGRYAFWMMNMKFALDMIWITQDLRVAAISENVPPCMPGAPCESVSPDVDCRYVLEVPAGFSRDNGITAGDTVRLR